MTQKREISLGLIGAGTVGKNVLKLFHSNKKIISEKTGAEIEFVKICDTRDTKTLRLQEEIKNKNIKITRNWREIVYDSSIDIVIELIGGQEPARTIILEAIKSGKHVVTANKAILSQNWDSIFSLARERSKLVYFEASVGAGIPVIQALNEGLAANKIHGIVGILNGTTNFILTKMLKENMDFKSALSQAKKEGFAEKNPHLDIKGIDTLHKLSILSSIAWGAWIRPQDIDCEGIENLKLLDVKYAHEEFGYVTKLLGVARRIKSKEEKYEIFVKPCLIQKSHPFANVDNEFNAILVSGDACGEIIFYGKGAGGLSAASAVVSDIIFLSRQEVVGIAGSIPYVNYVKDKKINLQGKDLSEGNFYIRFTTVEKPGVLSNISGILAKFGVSIASVFQKEQLSRYHRVVPILMLTHRVNEGNLRKALKEIDSLPVVKDRTVLLKIQF